MEKLVALLALLGFSMKELEDILYKNMLYAFVLWIAGIAIVSIFIIWKHGGWLTKGVAWFKSWLKNFRDEVRKLTNAVFRTFVGILTVIFIVALHLIVLLFFGMDNFEIFVMFEIFGVFATLLILGIAWKTDHLPQAALMFMTIETGDIKFIDKGQTNAKIYINIPGKVLRNGEIVDGDSEADKTFLQKHFGQYFIGIPPFRTLHTFPIVKERENQDIKPGMAPEDWIDRDDGAVTVSELRWRFPRPVLIPDVEFKDKIRGNILVLCNFEVERPLIPIYILKARFFEILASYIRIAVVNYCQTMAFNDFVIEADKRDGGNMSKDIINGVVKDKDGNVMPGELCLNSRLAQEVGIKITSLGVPQYNASKTEEQEALEAAELARLQGLATVAKAQKDAEALIIATTAQNKKTVMDARALAKADTILGKASVVDVLETAKNFIKELGGDPDNSINNATALGRAKRFSTKDSPVNVLADGQVNTTVPLVERKVVQATK